MNTATQKQKGDKASGRNFGMSKLFTFLRSEAVIIVGLVVGMYALSRIFIPAYDPAQITFVESVPQRIDQKENPSSAVPGPLFSGIAFETAQRLREAGALGMAVSLSTFATYSATGNLPPTGEAVLRDLVNRELLPPGIGISGQSVQSELSVFRFAFRSTPFTFEIVSLPKETSHGPALLLQFPLPPAETNSIMYFQSSKVTIDRMPSPYSTAEQLAAAGWSIRHWRGEALPLDGPALHDLKEHDAWLKSLNR